MMVSALKFIKITCTQKVCAEPDFLAKPSINNERLSFLSFIAPPPGKCCACVSYDREKDIFNVNQRNFMSAELGLAQQHFLYAFD